MNSHLNISIILIVKVENLNAVFIEFYSIMDIRVILYEKSSNSVKNDEFISSLYYLIRAIFYSLSTTFYFNRINTFIRRASIEQLVQVVINLVSLNFSQLLQISGLKYSKGP
jgi:hypothetical protein